MWHSCGRETTDCDLPPTTTPRTCLLRTDIGVPANRTEIHRRVLVVRSSVSRSEHISSTTSTVTYFNVKRKRFVFAPSSPPRYGPGDRTRTCHENRPCGVERRVYVTRGFSRQLLGPVWLKSTLIYRKLLNRYARIIVPNSLRTFLSLPGNRLLIHCCVYLLTAEFSIV